MIGKKGNVVISELLQTIGVTINGKEPWDIQIYNDQFYSRLINETHLGLGESYMDKWWDCARLDELFYRTLSAHLDLKVQANKKLLLKIFFYRLFNFQTKKRAWEVGKKHYDLGNLLFEKMLDRRMVYTCGYWKNATTLDEAQLAKLELSCQKLKLKPGMRILDIGCGWGSFAKYAAQNHGAIVTGITISKEQAEYAKKSCANLPVEIRLQDYRDLNEQYDRIISLGMFEHVGHLNYRTYLEIARRCLVDDGLFLLHTIGSNITYYKTNAWIDKYIFPQGLLPSIAQIGKAAERLFVMEDWHNFGQDYDKTLMSWAANFNQNWGLLKNHYDERFFRMWNYYLYSCAGSFRAREMQLWQIVFSKQGLRGGYQAIR